MMCLFILEAGHWNFGPKILISEAVCPNCARNFVEILLKRLVCVDNFRYVYS